MEDGEFKQASGDMNKIYDELVQALDDEEGCMMEGYISINKVPGNFHISTHAFGEPV